MNILRALSIAGFSLFFSTLVLGYSVEGESLCGEHELLAYCKDRACADAERKSKLYCLKFLKMKKLDDSLFLDLKSLQIPLILSKTSRIEEDHSDDEGDCYGICHIHFECVTKLLN